MSFIDAAYLVVDAFLIYPFRIPGAPIFGYLLGAFCLAVTCVMVGQFTLSVAYRMNRRWIDGDNREMVRMHNSSIRALLSRDKAAYKACNRQANDAFGKLFFSQVALSASGFWPIPFALAWLDSRFAGIDFALPLALPGVGDSVGYTFSFFPLYILAYILFGKVKRRLPYFRNIDKWIGPGMEGEKMLSLSEISAGASSTETARGAAGGV